MDTYSDHIKKEIEAIIAAYDVLVTGIDKKAQDSDTRAYGGIIRAGKGKLVESTAWQLIELAWNSLGESSKRIANIKSTIKSPINRDYLDRIEDDEIRDHIKKNIKDYYYPTKSDIHVYIDKKFEIAVECKSFTENAMYKRIMVDFTLLKKTYPDLDFALVQLESQLGGDYSDLTTKIFGSTSTHTLTSFFDIDLDIITLLRGERKVQKPIHKKEYYKPLTKENLYAAIEIFKKILRKYK